MEVIMKKVGRDPERLETLNLFSMLQSGDGRTTFNPKNGESFPSPACLRADYRTTPGLQVANPGSR